MEPKTLLGRVLSSEVDAAALLGYLALLDPVTFSQFLGLPEPLTDARVEVPDGKGGRMDLVLYGLGRPLVVIEMKIAATEHGNQLERYEAYAKKHGAEQVLLDLEPDGATVPPGWQRFGLVDVFACFAASSDPVAKAFGTEIADVFQGWKSQTRGVLADMTGPIVPVVLRDVAKKLNDDGYEAYATRTKAGLPCLVAFKPHPAGREREYFCVDLRCQDLRTPEREWLLRTGVQVHSGDDPPADRMAAHKIAMELAPDLTLERLRNALAEQVGPDVRDAIGGEKPLKTPSEGGIDTWLARIADSDTAPRYHPVFYQDWGRRLAARFTLDPSQIDAEGLVALVSETLEYLATSAARERSQTV